MTEWREVTIGELAEKIAMGPFGSNIKVETFKTYGIPIISGAHLCETRMRDKDFSFISKEHADRLANSNVYRGDVIFTHAGNIGQVSFIPKNSKYERYVISQRQFYLRCNSSVLDYEYITYYFKSPFGQHQLLANANQTGVPSLAQPVSYLKSIKISLPPLSEQKTIAEVLSSLDDKIDLLTRQNKTLEDLAQAYFRKWFIEDAKKEWEEKKLGDIIVINYGKALPERERISGGIPVYSSAGVTGWHNQYLVESNGIVIGRKGTIGTIFWVPEPFYCIDTAYYIAPNDSKYDLAFVYFLLQTMDLHELNEDSAVPGLNRNTVYSQKIQLPPKDLIKKFSLLSNTILQQIQANTAKIRTLTKLRDTLLPKLVSGEIRVKM